MIIDFSTHFCPTSVVDFLKSSGYTNAEGLLRGIISLTNMETRLENMNKYGIDLQVLTLSQPFCTLAKSDQNTKFCRIANNASSKLFEKYSDKFMPFAIVPLLKMNEALEELDRSVNELGLKGVHVFTDVESKPLDSPEFYPFFERSQKHDIPIFIHPRDMPTNNPFAEEYGLQGTLGWPFHTSITVLRLIFSGVVEKYPALKIVTHHLGCMIPYFKARIERGFKNRQAEDPSLTKSIDKYLKAFYGDTASVVPGWEPALICGQALFGPNRIVFGTDYPYGGGEGAVQENLKTITASAILEENKRKILEINAKNLLKLKI